MRLAQASARAMVLHREGVELRLNTSVTEVHPDRVVLVMEAWSRPAA
jgi:NADH dehydrogenase FAD-containing subunit